MKRSGFLVTALVVAAWRTTHVEGFFGTTSNRWLNRLLAPVSCCGGKDVIIDGHLRDEYSLRFSHSFQRHVVFDSNQSVIRSYEFLDSAIDDFPTATLIPQGAQSRPSDSDNEYLGYFAGCGAQEQTAYRSFRNITSEKHSARVNAAYDALMTLSNLSAEIPQFQHAVAFYLKEKSGKLRFINHTPQTIIANFQDSTSIFRTLLDMDAKDFKQKIVAPFPQICLYDTTEIADRIRFFLSPLPPKVFVRSEKPDWPLLASRGYGAGVSKEQLRQALCAVPHLMAMYYEDASLKPAIGYFLHVLQAPFQLANTATLELKKYLDGATFSDIAHVTFLNKLGITWDQLRIIFEAFPTLVVCDTQPSVEMLNKGAVRSSRGIAPQRLHYLQTRLQITPGEVKAMLITHSRLGTYSIAGKMKPTLDVLQSRLGLTSEDMRTILRRQPSIIGISAADNKGFNQRIDFFLNEISLSLIDLMRAVVRHPSLLEYNLDKSLRPKFSFLRDELCVPENKLAKVIKTSPGILGLSLDENLRPSAELFMEYLDLTPNEMGTIIATAPQILASSWKSNLEPKLRYLANRLDLDTPKLKHIIKSAPRLLLYNVERSIEPKLLMIEEVLQECNSKLLAGHVIFRNPSMIVTTNDLLRKRLNLAKREPADASVDIAGLFLPRLSPPTDGGGLPVASPSSPRQDDGKATCQTLSSEVGVDSAGLVHDIATSKYTLERAYASGVTPIVVYVAGRIYPRDSRLRVRGSQQNGGVSLFLPQVAYGSPLFTQKFEQIVRACFPQSVPESEYDFLGSEGIACVRFPGLRPSRTRTELAACHCALRAVLLLLVQESGSNRRIHEEHFQVDIYTGSEAVWRMLRNESRLLELGKYDSPIHFKNDTDSSKVPNNADLLFPLCRTFSRMMEFRSVTDQNGNSICLGKEVKIQFLHLSDGNFNNESVRGLGALARVAARWYLHYGQGNGITT